MGYVTTEWGFLFWIFETATVRVITNDSWWANVATEKCIFQVEIYSTGFRFPHSIERVMYISS